MTRSLHSSLTFIASPPDRRNQLPRSQRQTALPSSLASTSDNWPRSVKPMHGLPSPAPKQQNSLSLLASFPAATRRRIMHSTIVDYQARQQKCQEATLISLVALSASVCPSFPPSLAHTHSQGMPPSVSINAMLRLASTLSRRCSSPLSLSLRPHTHAALKRGLSG